MRWNLRMKELKLAIDNYFKQCLVNGVLLEDAIDRAGELLSIQMDAWCDDQPI